MDLHALDLEGVSPLQFVNKRLAGLINLVRKRRKAHPLGILEALCADLNQQPLSHVVVTGDVSNLSLPTEFLRARAEQRRERDLADEAEHAGREHGRGHEAGGAEGIGHPPGWWPRDGGRSKKSTQEGRRARPCHIAPFAHT